MKDVQDTVLPTDPAERKAIPIASGVLDYFPAAIAYIAKVSKVGNDQHNPGEPLHWARGKSMDHPDTIMRHFVERGTIDKDNLRHTGKAAWRMLALLQEELEREEGAPVPRGARVSIGDTPKPTGPEWRCKCGSTTVWTGYAAGMATVGAEDRPLCNAGDCYEQMERVH